MERSEEEFISPHQIWEVDLFRPEDAPGVARLFRLVYGDGYPVKTFTDPERLIAENAARRTFCAPAGISSEACCLAGWTWTDS